QGGRAGVIFATHYFQRRQLRFASFDLDHSGDGAGRTSLARLVAGGEPRDSRRLFVRRDSGRNRYGKGRDLVNRWRPLLPETIVWATLAIGGDHSGCGARRSRSLGIHFRVNAAIYLAAVRR